MKTIGSTNEKGTKLAHWTGTKEETIRKIIFLYSTSSHIKKELIHENELYIMNDLFFHSNPWQISPVSGTSTEKERDVQSNERVYLSQLIPHGSIGSSQSQQDEL